MSFLRNVLHDLLEKRLWPVAVALLAALVAVPIVLGGSSSNAGTDVAATTTNGLANHRDAARAQVVSLEQQAAGKVQRAGKVRDPFVQHHQPKTTTAAAVSNAVSTTKTIADALSGSPSSGSSGPSNAAPTPTTTNPGSSTDTTKKPTSTEATYRVKLRFGEAGAEKTYDNVARLTPLPSSDNPFFVYLGLQADQKSAVFLVDADAVTSGDGTCKPAADDCQQIVLKKGDMEFLELQSGTAGVVEYRLELVDITKVKASTTAVAATAHARESKAGREYLRQLVATDPTALDGWSYSTNLGLLVQKDAGTTSDVANLPPAVAQTAAGQPVEQTATVLTVPSTTIP